MRGRGGAGCTSSAPTCRADHPSAAGAIGHKIAVLYVNAGHPPGFLWPIAAGGNGCRARSLLSPAIREARWECDSLPLGPGDRLLLYTDGVTDGLYQDDDGESRIRAAIAHHGTGGPRCSKRCRPRSTAMAPAARRRTTSRS
jgi:hypothetical protein